MPLVPLTRNGSYFDTLVLKSTPRPYSRGGGVFSQRGGGFLRIPVSFGYFEQVYSNGSDPDQKSDDGFAIPTPKVLEITIPGGFQLDRSISQTRGYFGTIPAFFVFAYLPPGKRKTH